jgi:hypothetical protein
MGTMAGIIGGTTVGIVTGTGTVGTITAIGEKCGWITD